jgi:hypothetical protein
MRGITVGHNKIKNTGILFEVLVRQITSDTLDGRTHSAALDLLKKYFNSGKELGKEIQLYQAFFNGNRLSEQRAVQFLDMIIHQRKKLDESKLNREKYELIKEIRNSYDLKDFLSCKIPSYKIHASIYKTFISESRHAQDTIMNIQEVASARFMLIEHLLGHNQSKQVERETALLEEFKNQTEDLRLLSYKILIDRFNQKYDGLDDKQKTLLREYINDASNQKTLLSYIQREVPILQKQLRYKLADVEDKVLQIKLTEVASQLSSIGKNKTIKDSEITALIIGYQILKEID